MKYNTREEWLTAAIEKLTPKFEANGYKVPKLRVSGGWPSSGGTAAKKRTLGQAWAPEAASDGVAQIFISPYIEHPLHLEPLTKDACGVLPVLLHEICHPVVGNKEKHNKVFKKCATGVGLEGKMTSTHAGEACVVWLEQVAKELGDYPNARLDLTKGPTKKQGTRMIKCTCKNDECGFTVRTTKKWLEEVGHPHCPKHGEMESDLILADDDESGED
jgi:hypothetical protein